MRVESKSTISDVLVRSGPGHFTRTIEKFFRETEHSNTIVILPPTILYPLPNSMRTLQHSHDRYCYTWPSSLAIHHWGCSWQSNFASSSATPSVTSTLPLQTSLNHSTLELNSAGLPSNVLATLQSFLG
jgi:hypothetical protein